MQRVRAYALATGLVALALAARLSLDALLGQEVLPYAFLFLAVALTAWWVGARPAVFATLLGLLASIWLILPPRHHFAIRGIPELSEVGLYLVITGTLICLFTLLHGARNKAEAATRLALQRQSELELEIRQRRETEAALRRTEQQLRQNEQILEQKIADRTANLKETVEELEHFSYALVHDLRAPLRAMQMFAQVILEEPQSALCPQSKVNLGRIMSASARLDKLIQDSLNYQQAIRGALPLQPVDLHKLVSGLVETYPNLVSHLDQIHIEPELPVVLGNEAALSQCFSALLDNAVKFRNRENVLNVRVGSQITADAEGKVRVYVEDNGMGIPMKVQTKLFGMFQRHNPGYSGTGMGLAIVRKLAEKMGGRVSVESQEGKGSRFWLELQRA